MQVTTGSGGVEMKSVLDNIVTRLHGVRGSNERLMARCPAHDDRSPSLSIDERDGKILLYCHAGCSTEAICTAAGIKMRDLFSEPCASRKPEPRVVRDAQKQLVGLRSRLTPADRQREVTVVLAERSNVDAAIARALALAVEGELTQIAFTGGTE